MAAIAYGQYLAHAGHGTGQIGQMIVDDIRATRRKDDREHVRTLLHVLHHFPKSHPQTASTGHPWHEVY